MRLADFYKKAIFYYILIPACLALWPTLVAFVYLPHSKKAEIYEQKLYNDMNDVMLNILTLDPDRSKRSSIKPTTRTFDYFTAISEAARSCGISSPKIDSHAERKLEGKKIQEADITLQGVGIDDLANFLFTLQKRWATLESQTINLDKQKGLPNLWSVTIKFRYYF